MIPNQMENLGQIAPNSADVQARMQSQGFLGDPIAQQKERLSIPRRKRVLEAARLMKDVMDGAVDPYLLKQAINPTEQYAVNHLMEAYPGIFITTQNRIGLRETMSYSDYSALTVDILDRMLYGYYTVSPIANMPLVKQVPLRDMRQVARYAMDGAVKPFSRMDNFPTLTPSGAAEPPTERAMQQAAREVEGPTQRILYQPYLYQGSMAVNWQAMINDDLGIFQDQLQRLAISGNRTKYSFITGLYANPSGSGFNTTLFNSTFRNLCTQTYGASTNNPALSYQGLLDARTILAKQVDIDGQPIDFNGTLYLVVGPALETTAISMKKAIQADISVGGGTTNAQGFPSQRLRTDNWPMANVEVLVDKYLPLINTTSSSATMWMLWYESAQQARPALELGMLRGYETPQLFQKAPNTMRVGGGLAPEMGDFYSLQQEHKGVLVMGGTQVDGRSVVVSTGLGV